jgi:hypothetical protein
VHGPSHSGGSYIRGIHILYMTSIVTQMLPSQSQPNAKRKVQDDNPLFNAAKRAKREVQFMLSYSPVLRELNDYTDNL